MARKFTFSLEPVLDVRREREREAMLRVAELDRERLALEQRVRDLRAEADRARGDLRECFAGASRDLALRGVRLQANTIFSLHGQTHAGALALAGVLKRLESARAELMRATTERKAVERLRERRLEQWRAEGKRTEMRRDEEVASIMTDRSARLGEPSETNA